MRSSLPHGPPVAEGKGGRVYLSPKDDQIAVAAKAKPEWQPQADLPHNPRDFKTPNYGMRTFSELFTSRQLVALTTFSDLVSEARDRVRADARKAGIPDDGKPLNGGGTGVAAYADVVATYLALISSKEAMFSNTLARWRRGEGKSAPAFGRQAVAMVWDFAEISPFAGAGGDFCGIADGVAKVITSLSARPLGACRQADSTAASAQTIPAFLCTDPPYYDNIVYANLSDFFYVWLGRSLGKVYPDLFSTLLTPKAQELVATPYRFNGDKEKAERFFEEGLGKAFARMRETQHPDYPLTAFYAFKQAESEQGDEDKNSNGAVPVSTGWETMLEGLLKAGFAITGTWPGRTEGATRMIAMKTNALASSIVLVCRPRAADAPLATRREFVNSLKGELPAALKNLQRGNTAPVDLAQAAIGPGMAVFSRYSKVIEADGSPMRVSAALALINQTLDEVLAEQEGEFDADTRWAVAWFDQYGLNEGPFGVAETLSKAKNTAVAGLQEAGILVAKAGKVRLLGRNELDGDWDPTAARRLIVWEVTQQLICALEKDGEAGAGALLRKVGALGETARDLAYRLYGVCERKKWSQEGLAYNSLVIAWPEITRLARAERPREEQIGLGV